MTKKQPIQPLHDRVIILPMEADKVTKGGILIPDTAVEKPMKGTVAFCGEGIKGEPMSVKVGDLVLYGRHAGLEVEIEEKKYLLMREGDILAII